MPLYAPDANSDALPISAGRGAVMYAAGNEGLGYQLKTFTHASFGGIARAFRSVSRAVRFLNFDKPRLVGLLGT
jgi:hypothetical protein